MIAEKGNLGSQNLEKFAKIDVAWLPLPSFGVLYELENVFFAEMGHGIMAHEGALAGAVIATKFVPNFFISLMDITGHCFTVDLKHVCSICQKFIIEGIQTNFVILTNCHSVVDVAKRVFWSQPSHSTEITLVPSAYTRILCPVIPCCLPLRGHHLTPIVSFQIAPDHIHYIMKKVGKQHVKMRTLKFPFCSVQLYGEEINTEYEKLRGQKCFLTSCSVFNLPNSEHVIVKSSRSSFLVDGNCVHFRMRMIPV